MGFSPSSKAAIRAIDDLLAAGGIRHGRRTAGKKAAQATRPRRTGAAGGRLQVLRVPGWEQIPWLMHGFSTRPGGETSVYRTGAAGSGDLNLGFTAHDDAEAVAANRGRFLAAVAGRRSPAGLVTLHQIHSSLVRRVGLAEAGERASLKGDGLMTDEPGVLLGIQTADCVPVLVADRKRRAVAAFHAGWRGTLARIVEAGVGRMRLEFGSRPEDLAAAVGPSIGSCCYAVGEEVRHEFESQFSYTPELFREVYDSDPIREKYPLLFLTARAPGHSNLGPGMHLNLWEANRRQLLAAGVKPAAIHVAAECTACHTDRYFSHRAERGFTGRMLSAIGVR